MKVGGRGASLGGGGAKGLPRLNAYGRNENPESYQAGDAARERLLAELAAESRAPQDLKDWLASQTDNNFWAWNVGNRSLNTVLEQRTVNRQELKYDIRDDMRIYKAIQSHFANKETPTSRGLSTLSESPRQVNWANSIRENVLTTLDASSRAYRGNAAKTAQIKRTRAKLASEPSSRFWIDNFKDGVSRARVDYIIYKGL